MCVSCLNLLSCVALDAHQLLHQIGDKQFALVDMSPECIVTQQQHEEVPEPLPRVTEEVSELQITVQATNYEMGQPEMHRDGMETHNSSTPFSYCC